MLFLKYWHYITIAALLSLLGIQQYRINSCKAEAVQIKLEQAQNDVKILVKRNEVAKRRPSDEQLIDRLRKGTY